MSKEVLGEFAPQGIPVDQVNFSKFNDFNGLNRLESYLNTTTKVGETALRVGKKVAVPVGITVTSALTYTHPAEAKEIAESVEKFTIENDQPLRVDSGIIIGSVAAIKEARKSVSWRNWPQIGFNFTAGYVFGYHLVELGQESMETNPDNWKRWKDVAATLTSAAYITPTLWLREKASRTVGSISKRHKDQDTTVRLRNIMEGRIPITGANFPDKKTARTLQKYKQEYRRSDGTRKAEIIDELSGRST